MIIQKYKSIASSIGSLGFDKMNYNDKNLHQVSRIIEKLRTRAKRGSTFPLLCGARPQSARGLIVPLELLHLLAG